MLGYNPTIYLGIAILSSKAKEYFVEALKDPKKGIFAKIKTKPCIIVTDRCIACLGALNLEFANVLPIIRRTY